MDNLNQDEASEGKEALLNVAKHRNTRKLFFRGLQGTQNTGSIPHPSSIFSETRASKIIDNIRLILHLRTKTSISSLNDIWGEIIKKRKIGTDKKNGNEEIERQREREILHLPRLPEGLQDAETKGHR